MTLFSPFSGLGEYLLGARKGFDAKRKLRVEHVRYVNEPTINPRTKAHAMAVAMGRHDLAEKLK